MTATLFDKVAKLLCWSVLRLQRDKGQSVRITVSLAKHLLHYSKIDKLSTLVIHWCRVYKDTHTVIDQQLTLPDSKHFRPTYRTGTSYSWPLIFRLTCFMVLHLYSYPTFKTISLVLFSQFCYLPINTSWAIFSLYVMAEKLACFICHLVIIRFN